MENTLKSDALNIINFAIEKASPFERTKETLEKLSFETDVFVLSVGKAAAPMAKAAEEVLGDKIKEGLLVTKYGHSNGFSFERFEVLEAAHPLSDENSVLAAKRALSLAKKLKKDDCLLVLLSGGGSALLEKSKVPFELQRETAKKLLARAAEIHEINAVRKALSLVKGGRLAMQAYPAKVVTVALSDVIGNDKSVIASAPTVFSPGEKEAAVAAVKKYLPEHFELLPLIEKEEGEGKINDGGYFIVGDVKLLCNAAREKATELGYEIFEFSTSLGGEARLKAKELVSKAKAESGKRAYIFGGETTVTVKGNGLGGRNQEMALAAAIALRGENSLAFASVGSDGTDGPTDAAGGFADGETFFKILRAGIDPKLALEENDSYHALKAAGDLIITGPTGTNVNDITVVLSAR